MKGSSRRTSAIGTQKVRRVILFINPNNKQARDLGAKILEELTSLNIKADSFSFKGKLKYDVESGCDAAISLGGDGTVLYAARIMSPMGVPVLPVNLGTFGFIAGVQPHEWQDVFSEWCNGKAVLSRRLMLGITVKRRNTEVFSGCCLNDVVVSASGIAKIINLQVFYSETDGNNFIKLGSYRSDGLIASTPTGSTAYSLSAGGPIVDPELEAIIINPICPFTLSARPVVLPAGENVLVEVEKEQRSGVLLTVDGQVTEKLKAGDRIFLSKAPYPCLLIGSGREGFYRTLRTKFALAGVGEEEAGKSD